MTRDAVSPANVSVQAKLLKLIGAHACLFFEEPGEIRRIFKTQLIGNFRNGLVCSRQQVLGLRNQKQMDQFHSGFSGFLFQKIRLVNGAFEAPVDLAMKRGSELNEAYKQMAENILRNGHSCSIATHDKRLLDYIAKLLSQESPDQQIVEFEMLKGVAPEHLETMREKDFNTRVYLAYGSEWYLYLCNRLAEHPLNLYQALSDAVKLA